MLDDWLTRNGLHYKKDTLIPEASEVAYLKARKLEGRLYSDEEIKKLPDINTKHLHYKEWKIRSRSYQKLLHFFKSKTKPLQILDLGCGNAWMSNKLTIDLPAEVWAVDMNITELEQAARVFSNNRLHLVYANIFDDGFDDNFFDVIILASSVHYFSDLKKLLHRLLTLLKPNGKIYILDTIFYSDDALADAHKRSVAYYKSLGVDEMASHYYHHSLSDLQEFNYTILASPHDILNRFIYKSPFYHIVITKKGASF